MRKLVKKFVQNCFLLHFWIFLYINRKENELTTFLKILVLQSVDCYAEKSIPISIYSVLDSGTLEEFIRISKYFTKLHAGFQLRGIFWWIQYFFFLSKSRSLTFVRRLFNNIELSSNIKFQNIEPIYLT